MNSHSRGRGKWLVSVNHFVECNWHFAPIPLPPTYLVYFRISKWRLELPFDFSFDIFLLGGKVTVSICVHNSFSWSPELTADFSGVLIYAVC